jgi:hypothetical protein
MWPFCGLKLASPAVFDCKKEIGRNVHTGSVVSDGRCRENLTNTAAVIGGRKGNQNVQGYHVI